MEEREIERIRCNNCGRATRHIVRASYTRTDEVLDEDYGPFDERQTVDVLECMGCELIVVRFEFQHGLYGNAEPLYYPPPISRRAPKWKSQLPVDVQGVLEEVYKALQTDSPRLATMGVRTIVDLVVVDKVGDVGTFRQKLESLEKQGFVGRKNREFLAAALEAGNAAAHRGFALQSRELHHVMDIVENLLEAVYVLEEAAATVKKATPPRAKVKSMAPNPGPQADG
jgi:hypothetical protein